MAVYFDNKAQFPKVVGEHHLMSWHCNHPILAVSSRNEETNTDGTINFFVDEVMCEPLLWCCPCQGGNKVLSVSIIASSPGLVYSQVCISIDTHLQPHPLHELQLVVDTATVNT